MFQSHRWAHSATKVKCIMVKHGLVNVHPHLINLTLPPTISLKHMHACTHTHTHAQKTFHYIYIQLTICQKLPTYSLSIKGDQYLLILTFFFYTALF
jgi:hypothetical protein